MRTPALSRAASHPERIMSRTSTTIIRRATTKPYILGIPTSCLRSVAPPPGVGRGQPKLPKTNPGAVGGLLAWLWQTDLSAVDLEVRRIPFLGGSVNKGRAATEKVLDRGS